MMRYFFLWCVLFVFGASDGVSAKMPPCSGPPIVSTINGTDSVCLGRSVTLDDDTTGGTWTSSNTGIATITTGGVVSGISAGIDTVRYAVTNSCGTTVVTKTIDVVSLSVAGISGQDTVCEGASITLSDATAGGSWSSSDSAKAAIGPGTGIVTGIAGGSVTITYTLTSGCFVTMGVVVDALLPITGTMQICAEASGFFSDLTHGGAWSSSNITVATVNGSTGAEYGIAPGISFITYTLPNGCSAKVLATVNPLPLSFYVFGGGDYCAGTSGELIALNGSDTGVNYILYNGSAFVDSLYGNGSSLLYGPYTAAGTYQIYAVNIATRCTSLMPDIATIGVIPDNVPSVSIATTVGDTVCILANTTFTALPVNAGAAPSYEWFVNGGSVGTGDTYSYIPNNGDVVSVIISSDAVCAIPSTATSSMTMTTIPKVSPSVSLSVAPGDTVCEHVYATIIPAPVYGGPAPIYRWIVNGISTATGPVYHYLPMNGDNILCSMHSNYECLITDSAYSSNNINMTVAPLLIPTVTVTAYPGDTIREGSKDTIVATVVNGGTSLFYQWEINGTAIAGATTDTFTSGSFSGIDMVTCIVTSDSFCGGEPAIAYVVITDTDTVSNLGIGMVASSAGDIRVLPNPNKGVFTISGTFAPAADAATIEIIDILGQAVYKHVFGLQNGLLKAEVDMGDQLANGVYLIHYMANGASGFGRVILSR